MTLEKFRSLWELLPNKCSMPVLGTDGLSIVKVTRGYRWIYTHEVIFDENAFNNTDYIHKSLIKRYPNILTSILEKVYISILSEGHL